MQATVETINTVVQANGLSMLESRSGKLMLLVSHHRHLNWFKQSSRAVLGDTLLPEGCYYVTSQIRSFKDLSRHPHVGLPK